MRIYIITLICLIPIIINGQIIDPITGTNTPSQPISDFGPRNLLPANGSVFHGGFDLGVVNNPVGFSAYAVETAAINEFNFGAPYAYIRTGNWRYMHIFVGQTTDGLWNYSSTDHVLLIKDTQHRILYAYAPTTLYTDPTYYDEIAKVDVPVRRSFTQGDLVFRAGPYPASAPHLHIDRGYGSWENPYSFLPRVATGAPIINDVDLYKPITVPSPPDGYNLFNGDMVYNSVILTYEVTTADHDFDNLVLSISTDQVNFDDLTRWHYTDTGNGHLDLTDVATTGGRATGVSATPKDNIRFSNYGSERQADILEGIYPIDNLPGWSNRERFKYKWNTQQTITGSDHVLNFKYPDGIYYIRAIASDISQNHSEPNIKEVRVDNLKPYIEKIEIRKNQSEGALVYSAGWRWDESIYSLTFSGGTLLTIKADTPLFIKVYASEPMSNMCISAFGSMINKNTPVSNTNNKTWEFSIDPLLVTSGLQTIIIKSISMGDGTGIVGFTSKNPLNGSSISLHQVGYKDPTWSLPTLSRDDIIHTFEVVAAPLTTPSNVKATTNLTNKITITWDAVDDFPYYKVFRADNTNPITSITGSTWITGTSFNDINVTAGNTYYYWVKSAKSSSGLEESAFSNRVTGSLLNSTTRPVCDFTMNATQITKGKSVTFTDASTNNPTSWNWTFQGGAPTSSAQQNPVCRYDNIGTYTVALQVSNGNGNSNVVTKTINVVDAQFNISGTAYVKYTPHSGVSITFDPGGTIITDLYGKYSYDVPNNWTGTIKATKTGFKFIDVALDHLTSNKNIDLHGDPIPEYTINQAPLNPVAMEEVTFTLNRGLNIGYDGIWDFGDGSSTYNDHGFGKATHSFSCNPYSDNSYTARCFITKQDGTETYEAQSVLINIHQCTPIISIAEYTNGCSTVKLGQSAYLTDISYPYDRLNSVQIVWDAGHSGWEEYWRFYSPYNYPSSRQFPHVYPTKGNKLVLWRATTDGFLNDNSLDFNVVDCNSIVYSNNLSNCTYDVDGDVNKYWAGTIILAGSVGDYTVDPNKKIEFSGCNEIELRPGFFAQPQGDNYLLLTASDHCLFLANQQSIIESNHSDNNIVPNINSEEVLGSDLSLTVFPNPVTTTITLQYSGDVSQILSIEILNSTGTLMLKKTNGFSRQQQINVENFSPGVYCVRLVKTSKAISKVFIKS